MRVSRRPRNYPSGSKEHVGRGCSWGYRVGPVVIRRGQRSVLDWAGCVCGGLRGRRLCIARRRWRSVVPGINRWFRQRRGGLVRSSECYLQRCGGIKVPPVATRSPCGERLVCTPLEWSVEGGEQWIVWSRRQLLFNGGCVGANTLGERGRLYIFDGKRKRGRFGR